MQKLGMRVTELLEYTCSCCLTSLEFVRYPSPHSYEPEIDMTLNGRCLAVFIVHLDSVLV